MRIISGKYKGKILIAPQNLPVRPTADMQKEALFNVLANYYHFENISVLDLFAGTGNISFEFASRGVKHLTCIDDFAGCVQYIKKTAETLGFPIATLQSDVFRYIAQNRQKFDVVFADPPYDLPLEDFKKLVHNIFENEWLTPEGMLIIEHSTRTDLSNQPFFRFSRKYGGTVFSFFEPQTSP